MPRAKAKKMPFKTCSGCKSPAACKKAGKCMGKAKKTGNNTKGY